MKVNKSVAVAVVLGGLALSGVAVAGGYGHGGPGGGGFHHLLRDVELTEAQQDMLDAARPDRGDREARRAEREAQRDLIVAELSKQTPDAARLHALVDERIAERAERIHDQLDAALALYATFTPEQRAQVMENLTEEHEPGERRGGRGEHGPGGDGPRGDGPRDDER